MVFQNNLLMGAAAATSGSTAFSVGNSVILASGDSANFSRTNATPTNQKKWTYSTWVKRGTLDIRQTWGLSVHSTGTSYMQFYGNPSTSTGDDDMLYINVESDGTAGGTALLRTNNLLSDPHAWYHFIVIYDSDNDIPTERMKLFVNGKLVGSFATYTDPADGSTGVVNKGGSTQYIGRQAGVSNYFDGYLAECVFCDGQAYSPENFGEYDGNNIWRPKDPSTLTFGDNGFYLDFADSSDLGNDVSGNNNDFTANNLASGDQSTDTPTANQCVLTPLWTGGTLSQGNLTVTAGANAYQWGISSIALPTSGKWAFEAQRTSGTFGQVGVVQIGNDGNTTPTGAYYSIYKGIGTDEVVKNGSVLVSGVADPGASVVRCEYDADNKTIAFFDDGTEIFPASTGASDDFDLTGHDSLHFFVGAYASGTSFDVKFSNLTGTPTSGFKELSLANLTTPTIKNPQQYMDTFSYFGNGEGQSVGLGQAITESYSVANSAAFKKEDSCELDKTFSTTASSSTDGTLSVWFKQSQEFGSAGHHFIMAENTSGDLIKIEDDGGIKISLNGGSNGVWVSGEELLDIDKWHNLVVAFDLDNGTSGDRIDVYLDGVNITGNGTISTTFATAFKIGQDTIACTIGGRAGSSTAGDYLFDGYMAEYCWCDGQVLDADDFGQVDTTTNNWVPKDPSGLTFGNNGWYLDFADKNDLGDDESGNGNDWTESGFDTTNGSNQFHDTPTRNFATFDPYQMGTTSTTIENCMLHFTSGASGPDEQPIRSTFQNPKTGKWYAEFEVFNVSGYPAIIPFISQEYNVQRSDYDTRDADYGIRINSQGGFMVILNNVAETNMTATGWSYSTGDVVQVAIDCDNEQFWLGVNDSWNAEIGGDPADGGAGTYFPFSSVDGTLFNASSYANRDLTVNFGQWQYFDATDLSETSAAKGFFRFTPPDGFKACNNDNLKDIDSYQTALNITKNRDATDNWMVFDRVRGPYLDWHTNSINQQATNYNTLQRFLKHGQEVGEDNEVNRDKDKFTSFNWYMETTGSGTANEVGGINTTRTLVDSTGGISTGIFEGTGSASTIGHGIGTVPKFIILKGLDNSSYSTVCYHVGMAATDPETDYIQLNSTDDAADDSGMWNDTAPTSTVFSVGTGSSVNKSGDTMAYYAFANIEGYSKFGHYEGNGSTSKAGPLIYTGFRPQLVIIKNIEANSTYWMVMSRNRADNSPETPAGIDIQNPFQNYLQMNATNADTGGYDTIDMLSTGFRVVNTTAWTSLNTSGKRYIYMAWAEHPFGGESTTPVPAS